MELRYYQEEIINKCLTSNKKRQLYVLPTGAGKTVIFTEIAKKLVEKNKKVLILADMKILISQIKEKAVFSFNLRVETKQSYSKKTDFYPDFIFIDECHMLDSFSKNQYTKIIDSHPDSIIIGFTATPIRMNNGLIYGENKFWDSIDYEKTTKDLILQNYLCNYRVKIPNEFQENSLKKNFTLHEASEIMQKKYLVDLVVDSYERFSRKKTLIFACDIKHSSLIKEAFYKKNKIVKIVHSKLHYKEIQNTLHEFKHNLLDCVINVDMLTKGFDEPSVDTIILARPTHSIGLHRQIIGRGLRKFENKKDLLIVDLVNNFNRNGDIADSVKTNKNKRKKDKYFICKNCFEINFLEQLEEDKKDICLYCNFDNFEEKEKNTNIIAKESTTILATNYQELNFLEENYIQILSFKASQNSKGFVIDFFYRKSNQPFKKRIVFNQENLDFFKKALNCLGIKYNQNLDFYKNLTQKDFCNSFVLDFLS